MAVPHPYSKQAEFTKKELGDNSTEKFVFCGHMWTWKQFSAKNEKCKSNNPLSLQNGEHWTAISQHKEHTWNLLSLKYCKH